MRPSRSLAAGAERAPPPKVNCELLAQTREAPAARDAPQRAIERRRAVQGRVVANFRPEGLSTPTLPFENSRHIGCSGHSAPREAGKVYRSVDPHFQVFPQPEIAVLRAAEPDKVLVPLDYHDSM